MLRTEEQREKLCESCPLARVADLVGDSCTLLIIRDLMTGAKRFGDLETSLEGISTRTLTNKLKVLQSHDIVIRTEFSGAPKRVEYTLTKKGLALHSITEQMRAYGKKYL